MSDRPGCLLRPRRLTEIITLPKLRPAIRFIFVHGFANGREEELFANLIEQSEPLQFVLHRIFEFGKA